MFIYINISLPIYSLSDSNFIKRVKSNEASCLCQYVRDDATFIRSVNKCSFRQLKMNMFCS